MRPPLEQNYYELLEVPRDATIAELDRAYDRAKAYYGPGSIATYSLTSPDELKLVQDRIDEAYLVLAEENARAEYLARIGPPTPDERPLHREVRQAQAERDAARDKEHSEAEARDAAAAPPPDPLATAPSAAPAEASGASKVEPAPTSSAPARDPEPAAAQSEARTSPSPTTISEASPKAEAPREPAEATQGALPFGEPAAEAIRVLPAEEAPARAEPEERPTRAAPGPVPPPSMEYPEPIPKGQGAKPRAESARAPARVVEIPSDAVFSGELLRQVRESQGLSLQELSDRTKIGKSHLDNIEADRYDALPAQVYLRGFLMSYARVVRLDPLRVAKSYVDAASKAKPARPK